MKIARYFAAFAIVTLALSLGAFARDNHSGNFTLYETVRVGSADLQPGDYKADWSGPADAVKIDIVKNGKTVATANGQIKNLQQRSPYNAITTKTLQDNTKAVDEIDFNNRSEALVLTGE